MTRRQMLRAFDEASRRRKHADPEVVSRLRKAILDGSVIYDPIAERVELSVATRVKAASVNMHLEGGNA